MEPLLVLCFIGLAIVVGVLWGRVADLRRELETTRDGMRRLALRFPRREQPGEPVVERSDERGATPDEAALADVIPVGRTAPDDDLTEDDATIDVELVGDTSVDRDSRGEERREERRQAVAAMQRADAESASDEAGFSFEEIIGGKWLTWVGALAVVLGAGFFFKYAIDEGWIGPTARVLIGLVVGLATFGGGVVAWRRDYGWLAQGLMGAAAGVLYFDLWAAEHLYALIAMPVAFAAMTVVTIATLTFAASTATQPTAILGLIGGFLVPIVLNDGVDRPLAFFGYLMLLDVGVLAIALFHRWRPLQHTAFVGTLVLWGLWFAQQYDPSKLSTALLLTTAFFLLFVTLGVWESLVRRQRSEAADSQLVIATPIVYFGTLFVLTQPLYDHWHGTIAVLLAAFYGGLACLQWTRNRDDAQATTLLAGVGVTFIVLAVPLQLHGHWIVVGWALLAGVLVEAGLYGRQPLLRQAGFGLLAVVGLLLLGYAVRTFEDPEHVHTLIFRPEPPNADDAMIEYTNTLVAWTDIFNARSFAFLVSTAVLGLLAWEYRRRQDIDGIVYEWQRTDVAGGLLAGVPVLLLLTACVETFALGRRADWYELTIVAAFSMWATLAAVAIVAFAGRLGPNWLRRVGIGVFAISALFLAIEAMTTLGNWSAEWSQLQESGVGNWGNFLVNPRGLAFLWLVLGAVLAAWLARREDESAVSEHGLTTTEILAFLAHFTGFVMLTTEVYAQGIVHDWQTRTSLAITATWTLYAVGTLVVGIVYRSANVRILALALFLLTTGKVFLHDVWYLHPAIRTLAFTGLGVALLLVSWLYRRHRDRIGAWLVD